LYADADALALPPGEANAVVAQLRFVALRKAVHELVNASALAHSLEHPPATPTVSRA
jgi:hypothetical protein